MGKYNWDSLRSAYEAGGYSSLKAFSQAAGVNYQSLVYNARKWDRSHVQKEAGDRSGRMRTLWCQLLSALEREAAQVDLLNCKQVNELAAALERVQKGWNASPENQKENEGIALLVQAIKQAAGVV